MNKRVIFDAHCDTIQVLTDTKGNFNSVSYCVNILDAIKNAPYIQCCAAFVHPKYVPNGYKRVNEILDKFYLEHEKNKDKIVIVKNIEDISLVINNNLFGVLLTVENGSAIDGNLDNIYELYERGIRIMGVTWNNDNDLASGVKTLEDKGLTKLGKEYIKKLNEHRIIIDVSHVSEKSFYDIIDVSTDSIIATHSCAKKLCNHKRNLTDDQIKQIAKMNGVIGICFYDAFLKEGDNASIDDIIKHIEYIVNLVGIEHVGIGSDFEGVQKNELPTGITGINDINNLFNKMHERGFNQEEINKIAGGNFINVLNRIWKN